MIRLFTVPVEHRRNTHHHEMSFSAECSALKISWLILYTFVRYIFILILFCSIANGQTQEPGLSDDFEYRSEICSLNESLITNRQWLSFIQRVEAACGIRTQESAGYSMAVTAIANEIASKKSEYKAAFGRAFSTQSCSCKVDIFTMSADVNDTSALSEALCNATGNLANYEKDMKNIRAEMAQIGFAPKPAQKYQWTRERMFLKETVSVLSKAYKARTGKSFAGSNCVNGTDQ